MTYTQRETARTAYNGFIARFCGVVLLGSLILALVLPHAHA